LDARALLARLAGASAGGAPAKAISGSRGLARVRTFAGRVRELAKGQARLEAMADAILKAGDPLIKTNKGAQKRLEIRFLKQSRRDERLRRASDGRPQSRLNQDAEAQTLHTGPQSDGKLVAVGQRRADHQG
jgi:hypothetical protein